MIVYRVVVMCVCSLLMLAAQASAQVQPSPNHSFYFGYWYNDGTKYGKHLETLNWTNLYIVMACTPYDSSVGCNSSLFDADMDYLRDNFPTKSLYIGLQGTTADWEQTIIRIANRGMWNRVVAIEVHGEGGGGEPTAELIEQNIRDARQILDNHGLDFKPMGITLDKGRFGHTAVGIPSVTGVYARGLDFISVEAYADSPSDADYNALSVYLDDAKNRVAALGKQLWLIMQAYDRGTWTDMNALKRVQDLAYQKAAADPNCAGVTMFAYGRPGGTLFHPEIQLRHQDEWTALNRDSDGDGMPDWYETQFGLNPNWGGDAGVDSDGDGVSNYSEYVNGTHPTGFYKRYFAEGNKGTFFETEIRLGNPNATPASVVLEFRTQTGAFRTHRLTMLPFGSAFVPSGRAPALEQSDFSTTITSNVPVSAERTMRWTNIDGYGSSGETSMAGPASTQYFAEGATGSFALYYLFYNQNPFTVSTTVTYLRAGGLSPIAKNYSLPPGTRTTIYVNGEDPGLAATDVSAQITSSAPIFAERSMYLSGAHAFDAGTTSAAGPTSTSWTFAEGSTGGFFDCYLDMANPNPSAIGVNATYYLDGGGGVITRSYVVPASGRLSVHVNNDAALSAAAFAVNLSSPSPFVAERTMWWPRSDPNRWGEASNTFGATQSGTYWVVNAEMGRSGGPDQTATYIEVANVSGFAGTVQLRLLLPDGNYGVVRNYAIAANSRLTIGITPEFQPILGDNAPVFAVTVQSIGSPQAQIVVERTMYSNALGITWAAGNAALGTRLQ
jgi:hypothetical protein